VAARRRVRAAVSTRVGCIAAMNARLETPAIGGQPVRIRLRVRRFACARTDCVRKTFVEQVEDLTLRYGRHSQLLRANMETDRVGPGRARRGPADSPAVSAGEPG
jgi:hypothetical protein